MAVLFAITILARALAQVARKCSASVTRASAPVRRARLEYRAPNGRNYWMKYLLSFVKWFALLLLVLVVSSYVIARSGLKDLDPQARAELGGDYIRTEGGILSYTRQGPVHAPVIILVHGFSTPKFVWEQVTPTLLAAGYQVVTYDHLGRGFSDRPDGPYNAALYQSELSGLIAALELATPLTLVGYSMGGANVVDFAASNLSLVKQLVLIAPAGYIPDAGLVSLLGAPVVGEWLINVFGKQMVLGAIRNEVEAGLAPADMLAKFEQQAQYRGYTDALLSTVRHYPMGNLADRYRIVGDAGIPVTAIWGTDDQIVPFSGAALMQRDVAQLKLVPIGGGNHSITCTRANDVTALNETK
jgi:pimeloyl-ACP methyl ester carboxylesterase